MKKTLGITGIAAGALLLLLIVLPVAFKEKIKEITVKEGNKMLNAEFDFRTFDISLIRNFPRATISVGDFYIRGTEDFGQDTLVSADRISATINLLSLFSDSYDILRISVADAGIKAKVLEDGRANWDIMKPSEQQESVSEGAAFHVKLQKVTMERVDVVYDDRAGGVYASLNGIELACSGDMNAEEALLKLKADIGGLTLRYGGLPLLIDAKGAVETKLEADFGNMRFTFGDNLIKLNDIEASVNGMFAMPDDGYEMDLTLNTGRVGFKELLSIVPAMYTDDFKELRASGEMTLAAWAKGKAGEGELPAFDLSLNVSNGSFQYPLLPKSVDNINIAASVKSPGGPADLAVADISRFGLTIAGNPFEMTMHLENPVSDPAFAVNAKGRLDIGVIKDVYPLEGMELNGVLDADLDLQGRMSYVEREQYDRLRASGMLRLTDMLLRMKDMPDVNIVNSALGFSPQYVTLSETTVGIGRSDITADCRLENYMGYVMKGSAIKGRINLSSDLLDLNELMGAVPETEAEGEPVTAFKVPKNVDLEMNARLNRLLFSNLELDDAAGEVTVRNGRVDMRALSFNTLDGRVTANGYYSTAADPESPHLNASFAINSVSFKRSFETFLTIRRLVPIFEGLNGSFSGRLALDTRLDGGLNPVYSTMNGEGSLNTKDINISGINALDLIADAVNRPALKDINVKDLAIDFTISEGRITARPFDIRIADTNLNLSGSTGADQTIDYTGRITLPASAGALGRLTTLDLKIGGSFTSPQVTVDTEGMLRQAVSNVTEEAKERVLEEAGRALGLDISDARKQRDALIAEAQAAGDKLVEEARKQAQELLQRAGSNVVARLAAQSAGNALISEAEKVSASLVSKATAEGDKLVERAGSGE